MPTETLQRAARQLIDAGVFCSLTNDVSGFMCWYFDVDGSQHYLDLNADTLVVDWYDFLLSAEAVQHEDNYMAGVIHSRTQEDC